MRFKPNPQFKAQLKQNLSVTLNKGAEALEDKLSENLSAESGTRTGRHYPNLPRRSSAPDSGEYPQEQSGRLKEGTGHRSTRNPLMKEVFVKDDEGKLRNLEFAPPAEGGRAFMHMTMVDPETTKRMLDAMKGE